MQLFFKKAIAILLTFTLIFAVVPAVSAEDNDNRLLYGRKQLQKLENGNDLTKAYDRIVTAIEAREDSVTLSDLSLTAEDVELVYTAYRNDPHGHFWLGDTYSYSGYSNGIVAAFMPGYNELGSVSDEAFASEVEAYDAAVKQVINNAGIRSGMSDYEIELRLHNALVNKLDYQNSQNAHNSYGALVENVAVCQGYTLAFNYLLRLCGIEAHYVAGYSRDIPHAWSLVLVDGHYYYTDLTWDDPLGTHQGCNEIFHSYFNVTENILKFDHTFSPTPYELPVCEDVMDSYYAHNPERIMDGSPDAALVASFFNNGSASVYIPEEYTDSFISWFRTNIREIAELAGYDLSEPLSYVYTHSQNEYHLIIEGVFLKPEITVILGDVNGDGSINSMDSNTLRRILAGVLTPTDINIAGGDLDKDGTISSVDSNLLRRLIAGS
ncbi:MAG: hypothetical protein E7647_07775 [Ruminococcaceae bacterium]|nr:hypothetical protein [Oscillospiraceae bacterium]